MCVCVYERDKCACVRVFSCSVLSTSVISGGGERTTSGDGDQSALCRIVAVVIDVATRRRRHSYGVYYKS